VAQTSGRILAVGWVHAIDRSDPQALRDGCPKVGGIEVCGIQAISATREVKFEPQTKMLTFDIIAEYSQLHNGTLLSSSTVELQASKATALALPSGKGLAMDLELSVELPQHEAVAFEATVMADVSGAAGGGSTSSAGVTLHLNVSAPNATTGYRVAVARTSGNVAPTPWRNPFPVLPEEKTVSLRALVDRSIVEFVLANGRSAFTARGYPTASQTGVQLLADKAIKVTNVTAHEMGCGWAVDPPPPPAAGSAGSSTRRKLKSDDDHQGH
jgi:sucrose-6-phosphate hydrolase SacC (GH32 family)